MTRDKDFKKHVRARMAKTGERYTAARANLRDSAEPAAESAAESAARPAAEPVAPPYATGARGYACTGGAHAETAALTRMLAHAGVVSPGTGQPLSESLILGIGGGVGAGYFLFQYQGAPPSFFVSGRHGWQDSAGFVTGVCKRLGIAPQVHETGGAKAAAATLDQALAAGQPAMAWVNMYQLPYTGLQDCAEQPLMVVFGNMYHVVVVAGMDHGNTYYVDDRAASLFAVEARDLAQARAAIRKDKHRLLTVAPGSAIADVAGAVRQGMAACITGLRKQRMKNFRLEAIEQWAAALVNARAKDGWPRAFEDRRALFGALVGTFAFVDTYGTGGGFFRGMYAEFLDEAAVILGRPRLGEVAGQYRDLASQWSALARAAVPASVAPLAQAAAIVTEYDRVRRAGGPAAATKLSQIGRDLVALGQRMGDEFPLDDAAIAGLRADLASRLRTIHAAEDRALTALEHALG